ncbi:MAG TPA: hypothetical protein VN810_05845, partial [Terriglobales bacterium]|nr:hypothetical protein [Terriglobales bacterium]
MCQSGEVTQLEILVTRNPVRGADGSKHLSLLDGVNAEIRFQVEIEVQHVLGIAGLLGHDLQHFLLDGVFRGRLCAAGRCSGSDNWGWSDRRCDGRCCFDRSPGWS